MNAGPKHNPLATEPLPSRATGGLMRAVKSQISAIPLLGTIARRAYFGVLARSFNGSADYWEKRYRQGLDSGSGSYGCLALFKAEILNKFVRENDVKSVVEFGCGDGAQLSLAHYPRYHGIDVSQAAIERCRESFSGDASKSFGMAAAGQYDLALSLDVIYHLTEDQVFDAYMTALFAAARRFVIIYSSNKESPVPEPHLRHRKFTDWIAAHATGWKQREIIANRYPFDPRDPDNTSFADFYIFEKIG